MITAQSRTLSLSLYREKLNHTSDLFLFVKSNGLIISASAKPYMNTSALMTWMLTRSTLQFSWMYSGSVNWSLIDIYVRRADLLGYAGGCLWIMFEWRPFHFWFIICYTCIRVSDTFYTCLPHSVLLCHSLSGFNCDTNISDTNDQITIKLRELVVVFSKSDILTQYAILHCMYDQLSQAISLWFWQFWQQVKLTDWLKGRTSISNLVC